LNELSQLKATKYYNRFSLIYDWVSSDRYYRKPRVYAIEKMGVKSGDKILNIPCGTGQNFPYFQEYLAGSGFVVGVDLSEGMLAKARRKINKANAFNIKLYCADATKIDTNWVDSTIEKDMKFDSILCDLGLSGFPDWEQVIDNMITLLKPGGKIVIMDWYIEDYGMRGNLIKWVGKGEVDRPIYQYLKEKVKHFELNKSFKNGDMFVATGVKD